MSRRRIAAAASLFLYTLIGSIIGPLFGGCGDRQADTASTSIGVVQRADARAVFIEDARTIGPDAPAIAVIDAAVNATDAAVHVPDARSDGPDAGGPLCGNGVVDPGEECDPGAPSAGGNAGNDYDCYGPWTLPEGASYQPPDPGEDTVLPATGAVEAPSCGPGCYYHLPGSP